MAMKGMLIALPAPPAATAGDGFDANRAAARLQRILGDERPHPVDSAANDAVRERLIAEMRSVGLNPRITDDFACNSFPRNRSRRLRAGAQPGRDDRAGAGAASPALRPL